MVNLFINHKTDAITCIFLNIAGIGEMNLMYFSSEKLVPGFELRTRVLEACSMTQQSKFTSC